LFGDELRISAAAFDEMMRGALSVAALKKAKPTQRPKKRKGSKQKIIIFEGRNSLVIALYCQVHNRQ
jgi:hypothetical protein